MITKTDIGLERVSLTKLLGKQLSLCKRMKPDHNPPMQNIMQNQIIFVTTNFFFKSRGKPRTHEDIEEGGVFSVWFPYPGK